MHTELTFIILLSTSIAAWSQDSDSLDFVINGYIYAEDSFPQENVHVINYRNTKIVTTNRNGYFKTTAHKGDSLMINHVSLSPTIIHAEQLLNGEITFYIPFQNYQINTISNYDFKRDQEHLNLTMKRIREQLKIPEPEMRGLDSLNANPYDNEPISPGLDFRIILELLSKLKKK